MFRKTAVAVLMMIALSVSFLAQASDLATYTYDANGRLWTVTYANGTVITYTYDSAGNRSSVVTTCSGSGC